ncbi:MarR family winged helix-turn-helix transcriptional regulator [Nocardia yamanashiensis]|uniref:MarR family winged helix-turn-helix transcriptional regulator n=1 Tax=Nocardia yamanashiensis TaxID=209247 RepID=UPI000833E173|nr:hypothetical protein [Nocardia yamanashiensis]
MSDRAQLADIREQRPLVYWLKQIDRSIQEALARHLAAEDLDARTWQVFNTISYGAITLGELDYTMSAFRSDFEPTMRPFVDRLIDRGWVDLTSVEVVTLTPAGRRAHERVSAVAGELRARMLDCVSPAEQAVLMELLQRIASHVEELRP